MRPMVQVGDHTPEPAKHYAVRKTSWSVEEYRALADRFADAVQKFQIAVANENFAGVKSAYLDLYEVGEQARFLNAGLESAITAALGWKK